MNSNSHLFILKLYNHVDVFPDFPKSFPESQNVQTYFMVIHEKFNGQ